MAQTEASPAGLHPDVPSGRSDGRRWGAVLFTGDWRVQKCLELRHDLFC